MAYDQQGMTVYGAENLTNGVNEIYFFSFSTNTYFSFKAFLTDFSDQYKSNWNPQEIYGRMDPIYTYKNTVRTITLALDVPSATPFEAERSARTADALIRSLYPVYNDHNSKVGSAIIGSPPLFKIKFANLIANSTQDVASNEPLESGLLGWIDGFSFKPEIDSGFFVEPMDIEIAYKDKSQDINYTSTNMLYAKLFKVNFTFHVIHEHPLGTRPDGNFKVTRVKDGSRTFSHFYEPLPVNPQNGQTANITPSNSTSNTISNAVALHPMSSNPNSIAIDRSQVAVIAPPGSQEALQEISKIGESQRRAEVNRTAPTKLLSLEEAAAILERGR